MNDDIVRIWIGHVRERREGLISLSSLTIRREATDVVVVVVVEAQSNVN